MQINSKLKTPKTEQHKTRTPRGVSRETPKIKRQSAWDLDGFCGMWRTKSMVAPEKFRIADHATGSFLEVPAWKFWNLTQTSFSLRTSTCRASNPRGAGLEGSSTLPATVKVLLWQGQI